MASTSGYRSFSAKRERHTNVHTGTDPANFTTLWLDLERTLGTTAFSSHVEILNDNKVKSHDEKGS